MKRTIVIAAAGALMTACTSTPVSVDWPTYHRDAGGTRFSPLDQITPANVSKLQLAWTYHMRPREGSTPQPPSSDAGDGNADASQVASFLRKRRRWS